MASSFFASTGLTICALVFLILIIILISSKLQSETAESKIYLGNLYLTVVLLILEMVVTYTMSIRESIPKVNDILCESYVFLSIVWEELFVAYTYFLLNSNKKFIINKKFYVKLILLILMALAIPTLAVTFLDVSYIGGVNGSPYVIVGGTINLLHLFSFVGAITIILIFTAKKDKIKNLYISPLIFAFIVFCLSFVLQMLLGFKISNNLYHIH